MIRTQTWNNSLIARDASTRGDASETVRFGAQKRSNFHNKSSNFHNKSRYFQSRQSELVRSSQQTQQKSTHSDATYELYAITDLIASI